MSSVIFDKIVPFGHAIILDDIPVTLALKERVTYFLRLINGSVDRCEYCKPQLGPCSGSQFADLFNGVDHSSVPSSENLRKEAILYGISHGAVGCIMGKPDVYTESLGQLDETSLFLVSRKHEALYRYSATIEPYVIQLVYEKEALLFVN